MEEQNYKPKTRTTPYVIGAVMLTLAMVSFPGAGWAAADFGSGAIEGDGLLFDLDNDVFLLRHGVVGFGASPPFEKEDWVDTTAGDQVRNAVREGAFNQKIACNPSFKVHYLNPNGNKKEPFYQTALYVASGYMQACRQRCEDGLDKLLVNCTTAYPLGSNAGELDNFNNKIFPTQIAVDPWAPDDQSIHQISVLIREQAQQGPLAVILSEEVLDILATGGSGRPELRDLLRTQTASHCIERGQGWQVTGLGSSRKNDRRQCECNATDIWYTNFLKLSKGSSAEDEFLQIDAPLARFGPNRDVAQTLVGVRLTAQVTPYSKGVREMKVYTHNLTEVNYTQVAVAVVDGDEDTWWDTHTQVGRVARPLEILFDEAPVYQIEWTLKQQSSSPPSSRHGEEGRAEYRVEGLTPGLNGQWIPLHTFTANTRDKDKLSWGNLCRAGCSRTWQEQQTTIGNGPGCQDLCCNSNERCESTPPSQSPPAAASVRCVVNDTGIPLPPKQWPQVDDNNYMNAVKLGLLMGYRCKRAVASLPIDAVAPGKLSGKCPVGNIFEQHISLDKLQVHRNFWTWNWVIRNWEYDGGGVLGPGSLDPLMCLTNNDRLVDCFDSGPVDAHGPNINGLPINEASITRAHKRDLGELRKVLVAVPEDIPENGAMLGVPHGLYYHTSHIGTDGQCLGAGSTDGYDCNGRLIDIDNPTGQCPTDGCPQRRVGQTPGMSVIGTVKQVDNGDHEGPYLVNQCKLSPRMSVIADASLEDIMNLSTQPVGNTNQFFEYNCQFDLDYLQNAQKLREDNSIGGGWGSLGITLTNDVGGVLTLAVASVAFTEVAALTLGAATVNLIARGAAAAAARVIGVMGARRLVATMAAYTAHNLLSNITMAYNCTNTTCRGKYTGKAMVDLWGFSDPAIAFGPSRLGKWANTTVVGLQPHLEVGKWFGHLKGHKFSRKTKDLTRRFSRDGRITRREATWLIDGIHHKQGKRFDRPITCSPMPE